MASKNDTLSIEQSIYRESFFMEGKFATIREIAEVLEFCAMIRSQQVNAVEQKLLAEQAGRELLFTWLLPSYQPRDLSFELQRCLSLIATLLRASATAQLSTEIRWDCHYINLDSLQASELLACVVQVVLAMWRDGAKQIFVLLQPKNGCAVVTIEADRSGIEAMVKGVFDRVAGVSWEPIEEEGWRFVITGANWTEQEAAQLAHGA